MTTENNTKSLPYSFDLLFDIKTHKELTTLFNRLKDDLESLEELIVRYGINVERTTAKKEMVATETGRASGVTPNHSNIPKGARG